jgi:hypothetical protein
VPLELLLELGAVAGAWSCRRSSDIAAPHRYLISWKQGSGVLLMSLFVFVKPYSLAFKG